MNGLGFAALAMLVALAALVVAGVAVELIWWLR